MSNLWGDDVMRGVYSASVDLKMNRDGMAKMLAGLGIKTDLAAPTITRGERLLKQARRMWARCMHYDGTTVLTDIERRTEPGERVEGPPLDPFHMRLLALDILAVASDALAEEGSALALPARELRAVAISGGTSYDVDEKRLSGPGYGAIEKGYTPDTLTWRFASLAGAMAWRDAFGGVLRFRRRQTNGRVVERRMRTYAPVVGTAIVRRLHDRTAEKEYIQGSIIGWQRVDQPGSQLFSVLNGAEKAHLFPGRTMTGAQNSNTGVPLCMSKGPR